MLPYFHPTSILLIDDDPSFLDSFQFYFGDRFNCLSFQRPADAISYLAALSNDSFAPPRYLWPAQSASEEVDTQQGDVVLHLKTAQLAEMFGDVARFRIPTVVIVDYAMPGMNGVEFLRHIRHLPLGRLMLTGRADERTAIDAFNSGLIDSFFMKHEQDLPAAIGRKVEQLQEAFFAKQTVALKSLLALAVPFVADSVVSDHFKTVVRQEKLVEHCVTTEPPGIFGLKVDGRQILYFVADEDFIRAAIEIATAEQAPGALLSRLETGNELALFPTAHGFYKASFASTWERYCVPAIRLTGVKHWRVAVIDQPARLGLGIERPVSYETFRDSIGAGSV